MKRGGGAERRGQVLSNHGHISRVEDEAGAVHRCTHSRRGERPVCGDRVRWVHTGRHGMVTAIEPRTNLLARPGFHGPPQPVAANLDRIYVVIAPVPAYQPGLVDRYLVAAEHFGLAATLVLNKADLLGDDRADVLADLGLYQALGYPLVTASASADHGIDELAAAMAGAAGILVGQSGVGKSSLTRRLIPGIEIPVGDLSASTASGRHTTTATTLYRLPGGGAIIDSPGVRDFGLWHMDPRDVAQGFVELRDLVPGCRFRDCRHRDEPGCAVTAAVAAGRVEPRRLESYRGIVAGLERQRGMGNRESGIVNRES